MTIREREVYDNRGGFTVSCLSCGGKRIAVPLYDTPKGDFEHALITQLNANAHDAIHPNHDIVIFKWKRRN